MILTVDIGNTNTNLAVFKKGKILLNFKASTRKNLSQLDLSGFKSAINKEGILSEQISGVIICSVVPEATKVLKNALQSFFKIKPLIIGEDIMVPIKNRYKKPSQVGQDRLVAAYAAIQLVGAPAIVVDFGTATTIDVVSKKKEYLGGIIIPGINMGLEALYEKTALLPKVAPGKPGKIIGRDTKESILSGVYYGLVSLIEGLITKISQQGKLKYKVVFTGGAAKVINSYCKIKKKVSPNLILQGLQLIYTHSVRATFQEKG